MTADELRVAIERLHFEIAEAGLWTMLMRSDVGKTFLRYRRDKLAMTQALYAKLDPCAATKIAKIQGYEEEIVSEIAKLESHENVKKELEERLNRCNAVLLKKLNVGKNDADDGILSDKTKGK